MINIMKLQWMAAVALLCLLPMQVEALPGDITTIAGTGVAGSTGDGGLATAADINLAGAIEVDANGNIFFTEANKVRKIDAITNVITTVVGTGVAGYSGDGYSAVSAQISTPRDLSFDSYGNLYIAEGAGGGLLEHIRKVNTSGIITTIATSGGISSVEVDKKTGTIYYFDRSASPFPRVMQIDAQGVVSSLPIAGSYTNMAVAPDGRLALTYYLGASRLYQVHIYSPPNYLYDRNSFAGRLSQVGNLPGYFGDGGVPAQAGFQALGGLTFDAYGSLFIADSGNHAIRKIAYPNTRGRIQTIAGNSIAGFTGDNAISTASQLNSPRGVAVDAAGNIYIADRLNNRIRKIVPEYVPPTGTVTQSSAVVNTLSASINYTCADNSKCYYAQSSGDGGVTYSPDDYGSASTTGQLGVDIVTLSSGDGIKDVYTQLVDIWGNVSGVIKTSVTLDQTPPAAPVVLAPTTLISNVGIMPTVSGTAEAGSTINLTVTSNANMITTAPVVVGVGGNWSFAGGGVMVDGNWTFRLTATDAVGNISAATVIHYIVDRVAPVFNATPFPDRVSEANGVLSTLYPPLSNKSATDISTVTITNDAPAGGFPVGTTVVTWTATDALGLQSTATENVIIQDTKAPNLSAPVNVQVEATGVSTTHTLVLPNVTDVVGVATLTNNAPATYPLGTTVVTWTASDASGNTSTFTQNIVVADTTAPVFSGTPLADIIAEATGVKTSVLVTSPTATDLFAPVFVTDNIPFGGFPLGTTRVTWTATDANGNSSSVSRNIIVADTTAPVFQGVANDVVVEATGSNTTVTLTTPTAFDLFGIVSTTNNAPAGYPLGTTVVTWTATDANGNTTTMNQNVIVLDRVAPVFTGAPLADVAVEATGVTTAMTLFPPSATDLFGVPSMTNNAPAAFPVGTTVVVWTATDANGNVSTANQNVVVSDTRPPVITITGNQYITLTVGDTFVDEGATWTDIVDGNGTLAAGIGVVDTAVAGQYTITYDYTDAAGNAAVSAVRNITVTAAPVNGGGGGGGSAGGDSGGGGGCLAPVSTASLTGLLPMFGLLMMGLYGIRRKEE